MECDPVALRRGVEGDETLERFAGDPERVLVPGEHLVGADRWEAVVARCRGHRNLVGHRNAVHAEPVALVGLVGHGATLCVGATLEVERRYCRVPREAAVAAASAGRNVGSGAGSDEGSDAAFGSGVDPVSGATASAAEVSVGSVMPSTSTTAALDTWSDAAVPQALSSSSDAQAEARRAITVTVTVCRFEVATGASDQPHARRTYGYGLTSRRATT